MTVKEAVIVYKQNVDQLKALSKLVSDAEKVIKSQGIGFKQDGLEVIEYGKPRETVALAAIREKRPTLATLLQEEGFINTSAQPTSIKIGDSQ